jgi:sucrose phosphorylase
MKNQVQLITYVDRFGGSTIRTLQDTLNEKFPHLFGAVHLLPFYTPIDGADAGFDPTDHLAIDPRLGTWKDLYDLANHVDVLADVIVNHLSAESAACRDFFDSNGGSADAGLLLSFATVFPNGATEQDLSAISRQLDSLPFTRFALKNGENRWLWTSFTPSQIDINVKHPAGQRYLHQILLKLAENQVKIIRLDAVGYAIKKAGTRCFMIPETFDFIETLTAQARAHGLEVLVEVHSHFLEQIAIAKKVDWVYDFALPPLVLHAFAHHHGRALKHWIAIRPHNAITVLDTHDGIGVQDMGPSSGLTDDGLVPKQELDAVVDYIHRNSKNQSRAASGNSASNVDLYQINCTFFDALARNANHYLLARALQFFLPGVPQVYYVGLLAGENDMALLAQTGVGRDINRQRFTALEIDAALAKPVVRQLLELIQLRNQHPAFSGHFAMVDSTDTIVQLRWTCAQEWAELTLDFATQSGLLSCSKSASDGAITEWKW